MFLLKTVIPLLFGILVSLIHPILTFGQESLITDRPTQSLSASITPINNLLWETGTLLELAPEYENWVVNNSLFRFGISKSVELRAVSEFKRYNLKTVNETEFRINNIQLGLRYKFIDKKVQVAYTGHIIFPKTNTVIDDIYGQQVGTSNYISAYHTVAGFLGFTYNIGYQHLNTSTDILGYSYAVSTNLADRLAFFVEAYGSSFEFDDFSLAIDAGFTYLILPNLQFDLSFADDLDAKYNYYSLGISWRIGSKNNSPKDPD